MEVINTFPGMDFLKSVLLLIMYLLLIFQIPVGVDGISMTIDVLPKYLRLASNEVSELQKKSAEMKMTLDQKTKELTDLKVHNRQLKVELGNLSATKKVSTYSNDLAEVLHGLFLLSSYVLVAKLDQDFKTHSSGILFNLEAIPIISLKR